MVTKLQMMIQKKDYRVLLENLISLSTLQLLNNILPLLTMPYLVRVLGPSKYGIISLAQAMMQYFINFTDYGFNLTATKDISINRENKKEIDKIFTNVFTIKLVFMLISLLVLILIVISSSKLRSELNLFILTFGMVIGNVLFPNWFFQGIEKMKYITYINVVAKVLFTILVFVFIKSVGDYMLVPLFYTLGFILSGVLSLRLIFTKFNVRLVRPSFKNIKHQIKDGWYVFLSTFILSLYTNTGIVVLGILTSNAVVGYYSAGEKVISAVSRMISPVQQAIFPYISKLTHNSKAKGFEFIQKISILVGSFTFLLSLILFIFSDFIITTLLGTNFSNSIYVFKILSFMLFFHSIALIYGIQAMLSLGYKKAYTMIIFFAFLVNIVLVFIFSYYFEHTGCAAAILVSEIFIALASILYLKYKGINILKYNKFS